MPLKEAHFMSRAIFTRLKLVKVGFWVLGF